MITEELKSKIIDAIQKDSKNYSKQSKHAIALGINPAQLSRIINNDLEGVLSDPKWLAIARRLNVQLSDRPSWVTAKTKVFNHIYSQLEACQKLSLSGILCDMAGIGKTYTAELYCSQNKNAVYVDCGQVKQKQRLIRFFAKELGLNHTGKYSDVYADLVFYINTVGNVLFALDEVADLDYPAFLELKALWNATRNSCGWYMMGADGLEAKITRNKDLKKVGYAEIFDRFGAKYQRIAPLGKEAVEDFKKDLVSQVGRANGITDIQKLYARTDGSLRRVYTEVQKLKVA